MADEKEKFPPPLNMSKDWQSMVAFTTGVMSADDTDGGLWGVVTMVTPVGHYDFFVDEKVANELIQGLRTLLRGDAARIEDA